MTYICSISYLQIKYECLRHYCDFFEVGQQFAEQPYAVAVQRGNYLQMEIGQVILALQKDRYFETLSSKYWNGAPSRFECPASDDSSEGITLGSLAGVFITALVGLGIALIVLIGEALVGRWRSNNNNLLRQQLLETNDGKVTITKSSSINVLTMPAAVSNDPTTKFGLVLHQGDNLHNIRSEKFLASLLDGALQKQASLHIGEHVLTLGARTAFEPANAGKP